MCMYVCVTYFSLMLCSLLLQLSLACPPRSLYRLFVVRKNIVKLSPHLFSSIGPVLAPRAASSAAPRSVGSCRPVALWTMQIFKT